MPSDERPARRGADLTLTAGVLVAVFASLLPLMRVVRPSSWLLGAIVLSVAILAAGFIARRYRLPALAVTLIEASVWVAFMMLVFLRDTALLWVIPTPETVRALPGLLSLAGEEIALGAAPLDASLALSMLIVGGTGLLTIVVDHVVLTARMPLLAAIGLIAVSLIPSIAVPGEVDVMAFVLLAAAILFLMRTDTRSREEPTDREATRTAGVPATALGIGAIAVVVALVAAPMLPQPVVRAGSGTMGSGPGIDATLQLGDDLRRPREVEVLKLRSDAPTAPYLRATTLSQLEGSVWEPDKVRTVPLENELALGTVEVDEDIRISEYVTNVEVAQSRLAVAAGRLPCDRGERTAGTVGGRAVQPHRPHPGLIDPGPELRGRDERAPADARADPRSPCGRPRSAGWHDGPACGDRTDRRRARRRGDGRHHQRLRRARRTCSPGSAARTSPTRSTRPSRRGSTDRAPTRWPRSSKCARATASTSRPRSR